MTGLYLRKKRPIALPLPLLRPSARERGFGGRVVDFAAEAVVLDFERQRGDRGEGYAAVFAGDGEGGENEEEEEEEEDGEGGVHSCVV